jgi:oligosaccharide reducing-end xylanase
MKVFWIFIFVTFLLFGCTTREIQSETAQTEESASDGSYYTGSYSSAVDLPGARYDQRYADNKCDALWNYFKSELLANDGAVIKTEDNVVVSEGQSYGMMLAVQNNDQDAFDNIWLWTKTHMQQNQKYGLFSWKCTPQGEVLETDAATDADEMIAMALFFASNRWGDGASPYDYSVQAEDILNKLLDHVVTSDNYFAFSPEDKSTFSPSYMMPAFYRLFAIYSGNSRWDGIADKSYSLVFNCLKGVYANTYNGLVPDFCDKHGVPKEWGKYFYYDAVRTPWHIAVDEIWFKKDSRSQAYLDKIIGFFGPMYDSFGDQYSLDGDQLSYYHVTSWIGCLAGGSIGANYDEYKLDFFHHLIERPLPTGQYRYYDICWMNFGILLVSGNFKIY